MSTTFKIMTVKDLKTILTKLTKQGSVTDSTEVWISADEEGNSFSPMAFDSTHSLGVEPNDKSKLTLYPSNHINVQDYGDLP